MAPVLEGGGRLSTTIQWTRIRQWPPIGAPEVFTVGKGAHRFEILRKSDNSPRWATHWTPLAEAMVGDLVSSFPFDTSCRNCGAPIPPISKTAPIYYGLTTAYRCACGHWNDLKRRKGWAEYYANPNKGEGVAA